MEKDEQQKRSEVKCIVGKVLVTFSATRDNDEQVHTLALPPWQRS